MSGLLLLQLQVERVAGVLWHLQSLWRKATRIRNGCWHCSYCFGPTEADLIDTIKDKLHSFSHTEYDRPPWTDSDYIRHSVHEGVSLIRNSDNSIVQFTKVPTFAFKLPLSEAIAVIAVIAVIAEMAF